MFLISLYGGGRAGVNKAPANYFGFSLWQEAKALRWTEALFPTWGYKFTSLTFKWFGQVFTKYKGLQAFRDSFVLSLISAPITALLSMIISYLVVKRKFKAKGFIEAVSMLAMAVPGAVLGAGFIRGFSGGLFPNGILGGLYQRGHPCAVTRPERRQTPRGCLPRGVFWRFFDKSGVAKRKGV